MRMLRQSFLSDTGHWYNNTLARDEGGYRTIRSSNSTVIYELVYDVTVWFRPLARRSCFSHFLTSCSYFSVRTWDTAENLLCLQTPFNMAPDSQLKSECTHGSASEDDLEGRSLLEEQTLAKLSIKRYLLSKSRVIALGSWIFVLCLVFTSFRIVSKGYSDETSSYGSFCCESRRDGRVYCKSQSRDRS